MVVASELGREVDIAPFREKRRPAAGSRETAARRIDRAFGSWISTRDRVARQRPIRYTCLSQGFVAGAGRIDGRIESSSEARVLQQNLRHGLRGRASGVESDSEQHGRDVRMGWPVNLHQAAAVPRRALHRIEPARISRRTRARILGNSITTDHISPISSIKASSTAGLYLQSSASHRRTSTITARGA